MSYRLIDSNAIAIKYPEVNEMPCVFANLPDGMNGQFIDVRPEVLTCGNGELVAQPKQKYIKDELGADVYTTRNVQPEPKEGEWIPVHPLQGNDPGAYMCSKCKTGMWEIRPSSYHYCPNCGAKMTTSTK